MWYVCNVDVQLLHNLFIQFLCSQEHFIWFLCNLELFFCSKMNVEYRSGSSVSNKVSTCNFGTGTTVNGQLQ